MHAAVADRVFDPFYTTKEVGRGTGLGLATVQSLAHQAGGGIEVDSRPEGGTTFRIELPLVADDDAADAGSTDAAPAEVVRPSRTVLVVEDDEGIRRLVGRLLSGAGHRVLSAGAPSRALHLLRDRGYEIDVLVSDAIMPEMSGYELLEEARATRPGLPVLLVSGYVGNARGPREAPSGARLLRKPFSRDELLLAVEAVTQTG
jgi:hypothetical protein